MTGLRAFIVFILVLAAAVFPRSGAIGGDKDKSKDEVVSAADIAKVYADGKDGFDKSYQGKTITVEGVVSISSAKDGGKSYLILNGYTKPGDNFEHIVRFVETDSDFEGIRIGHKVRIRGVVQGHKELLNAVELRECKVVKVFADEYPPSKEVRAEVKKLQGKWKVTLHEANGKKLEGAEAPFTVVRFEGYDVYLHQGTPALRFGLALDLGKDPKRIDLVGAKATLPSIYTLDGDKMQLFLPASLKTGGFLRPSGFDTGKNAGILLSIERQK